jgi:periplasmic protein TonB
MRAMSSPAREFIRWAACAAVVLMAHAAVGAAAVTWRAEADEDDEPSGAIVMELAPVSVTRSDVPLDIAPGPDQVQSEAARQAREEKQADKAEEQPAPAPDETPVPQLAAVADAEAVLPQEEKPPEQTREDTQARMPAPVTSAAQALADEQGPVARAPVQAAPNGAPSDALPKWRHRLEEVLERNKRYPATAQRRREQGVTVLSFVVDGEGKLLSSRIVHSSGYAALDEEAMELLRRSVPFPPPPAGSVSVEAPVRFNLR